MLIAVLFIAAKSWKQPRCLSTGEWFKKLWHIQKMEHYSVLNRNELSSREKTWRNLKGITKRSQYAKATYYMIQTMTFWESQNY